MSQMSTQPVFFCRGGCGKILSVSLQTTQPDPDATVLRSMMPGLEKIAICKACRARQEYANGSGGVFYLAPPASPIKVVKR